MEYQMHPQVFPGGTALNNARNYREFVVACMCAERLPALQRAAGARSTPLRSPYGN